MSDDYTRDISLDFGRFHVGNTTVPIRMLLARIHV